MTRKLRSASWFGGIGKNAFMYRSWMNVAKRRLHLHVSESELTKRREVWQPPPPPETGNLRLFSNSVLQADRSCDFDFLSGTRGAPIPNQSH